LTISDIEILRSNCNKETIAQWQTARNRARPMKQSTSLVQDGNTKESFQIFIRVSRAAHRNLETHESSRKFDICGYLRFDAPTRIRKTLAHALPITGLVSLSGNLGLNFSICQKDFTRLCHRCRPSLRHVRAKITSQSPFLSDFLVLDAVEVAQG